MLVSFAKIKLFFAGTVVALAVLLPFGLHAATHNAQRMVASQPVSSLTQVQPYTYRIGFKNTGAATWKNTGTNRLTVKTTESIKYEHWFASAGWLDKTTVTALEQTSVAPGQLGFFALPLESPRRSGTYHNKFAVYAGTQKIAGTDFTVILTVGSSINTAPTSPPPIPTSTTAPETNVVETKTLQENEALKINEYAKGFVLLKSANELALNANEKTTFKIGVKNTGERNWRNAQPSKITLELDPASVNETFADNTWTDDLVVMTQTDELVKEGQLTFFEFSLRAPSTGGSYKPQFRLVLNGDTLVSGTDFRVPITVTAPTAVAPPPTVANALPTVVCLAAIDDAQNPDDPNASGACQPKHEEPLLRVGLAKLTDSQLGVTANHAYRIADTNGKIYGNIAAGLTTFLAYDKAKGEYTAVGPGPIMRSALPLQVKANAPESIITLTTFNNPVAYNPGWNDNVYRGAIELRWSEADEKLWIINELPMREYLYGLAESSNRAPAEYQKALVTAARTYALYHYQTKVKHRKRHFDVVATVSDQYYRGYESEKRIPAVRQAVDATIGQVVTWNGHVVVTPYSASTSGVTRTWSEVWGGSDKPWLVKKAVPWDANRRRFGHAVGLSQLAAADMAKEGQTYLQILTFFYEDTAVAQWY